ncbi:hypothetical protein BV22DRAFT_1037764 [Leucogyrophana mollusca]|uniref:Uncharacterized protein n=1 Tax=Leucogyrophana mollusca TaxID=85980 RepID=A0ACB8B8Q2_9AGAM|nr:hypothetical protein BV22DRAFT_1037764 [Leucogyrophana mollusca]
MTLKAGQYVVTCHLTGGVLGRDRPDDRSGGPKPVVLFPSDSEHVEYDAYGVAGPTFVVEPQGNSRYILKIGGDPTLPIGRQLYTTPDGNTSGEKWVITQHRYQGPYTIETADRSAGWAIVDDISPTGQIAVRPLLRMPGYPAPYPSDELFDFTPVEKARRRH